MSYGTSLPEMYHQVGVRAKPADFAGDLVNQVRTGHQRPQIARMLSLTVPPGVLAIVDEVIE